MWLVCGYCVRVVWCVGEFVVRGIVCGVFCFYGLMVDDEIGVFCGVAGGCFG